MRSIMIWGDISVERKSDLIRFNGNVTADRYQNAVLQPTLLFSNVAYLAQNVLSCLNFFYLRCNEMRCTFGENFVAIE